MRVSPEQIAEALSEWRGHVPSAARALGISDWALRKRMRQLGLRSEEFTLAATDAGIRNQRNLRNQRNPTGTTGATQPLPLSVARENSESAIRNWQNELGTPILSAVPSGPPVREQPAKPGIPAARTKPQAPARLKPDQEDQLTRFRLNLQSAFAVEWTNSDILQWLFRETAEGWFTEKGKDAPHPSREERKGSR